MLEDARVYAAILPLACYTSHFAFDAASMLRQAPVVALTPRYESHTGNDSAASLMVPTDLHGCSIEGLEK
jgi:hypothetical protein